MQKSTGSLFYWIFISLYLQSCCNEIDNYDNLKWHLKTKPEEDKLSTEKLKYENSKENQPKYSLDNKTGENILDLLNSHNEGLVTYLKEVLSKVDRLQGQLLNVKHENHLLSRQMKKIFDHCIQQTQARAREMISSSRVKRCPKRYVFDQDGEACYKFVSARVTWRQARERCQVEGADLVQVESSHEQAFLNDKARSRADTRHCDFWTSGTDQETEGKWKWTQNGRDFTYLNWMINEPNNSGPQEHCMQMLWVFGWAWNDAGCKSARGCYICQVSPV